LRYISKLDLKKTTDILENLNSGFISFGKNMQFNFNKKFSQLFTSLVNDIFSTENKNENILPLLKTLKLEEYLDEKIKSKNTENFFENESNDKMKKLKKKKTSIFKINKTVFVEKENNISNDFPNYNNNFLVDESKKGKESNKNNQAKKASDYTTTSNSDIILLLLFFYKESILIDQDLETDIVKFINEKILINLNSDNLIDEIVNIDFLNNIKINKYFQILNNEFEKNSDINTFIGKNIYKKDLNSSLQDQYYLNKSKIQNDKEPNNHFTKNVSNNINDEDKNVPEILLKNLNDNSYSNFLNNFSFNTLHSTLWDRINI